MGHLKDDVMSLHKDLEHLHDDIGHLGDILSHCACGSGLLDLIQAHVHDLDTHIHDVLAHVINTGTLNKINTDDKSQLSTLSEKG